MPPMGALKAAATPATAPTATHSRCGPGSRSSSSLAVPGMLARVRSAAHIAPAEDGWAGGRVERLGGRRGRGGRWVRGVWTLELELRCKGAPMWTIGPSRPRGMLVLVMRVMPTTLVGVAAVSIAMINRCDESDAHH